MKLKITTTTVTIVDQASGLVEVVSVSSQSEVIPAPAPVVPPPAPEPPPTPEHPPLPAHLIPSNPADDPIGSNIDLKIEVSNQGSYGADFRINADGFPFPEASLTVLRRVNNGPVEDYITEPVPNYHTWNVAVEEPTLVEFRLKALREHPGTEQPPDEYYGEWCQVQLLAGQTFSNP